MAQESDCSVCVWGGGRRASLTVVGPWALAIRPRSMLPKARPFGAAALMLAARQPRRIWLGSRPLTACPRCAAVLSLLNLGIFLRVATRYVYKTVPRKLEAPLHQRPRWYQAQEQQVGAPANIPVRAAPPPPVCSCPHCAGPRRAASAVSLNSFLAL